MIPAQLASLGQTFHALDIDDRHDLLDALVQSFRPSDYRHMASRLFPDRFVGDIIARFPPELVQLIFSYLEPRDIYRLRSVSSLWNDYLQQPEVLSAMDRKFYGPDSEYNLDYGAHYRSKTPRSYEQKVRNHCALLNGRARFFDIIKHPAGSFYSLLAYCNGILALDCGTYIYVYDLFSASKGWSTLHGDDLETFCLMQLSDRYLMALTHSSTVYVWDVSTCDWLAKFRLPSLPYEMAASADTIVLFCSSAWYFYHVASATLHRHAHVNGDGADPSIAQVESSGYLYHVSSAGVITTYHLTYEPVFNLETLHRINVNDFDVSQTYLTAADEAQEGTVRRNRESETSKLIVASNTVLYRSRPCFPSSSTAVYELYLGRLIYRQTIHNNQTNTGDCIFFPQISRVYDLLIKHDRGMPLGLYQIHNDAWRRVTVEKCGKSQGIVVSEPGTSRTNGHSLANDNAVISVEDTSWALSFEDPECLWTGDANFLVSIHKRAGFSRVWQFCEQEQNTT